MPAETASAPHPELAGLTARKEQLTAKLAQPGLSDEAKERTAFYLREIAARIAEISK